MSLTRTPYFGSAAPPSSGKKRPDGRLSTAASPKTAAKTCSALALRRSTDIDDGCYLPLTFITQAKRPSLAAEVFFRVAEAV
jgi:hypothetical protein